MRLTAGGPKGPSASPRLKAFGGAIRLDSIVKRASRLSRGGSRIHRAVVSIQPDRRSIEGSPAAAGPGCGRNGLTGRGGR